MQAYCLLLLLLLFATPALAGEVRISAAASLTDAIKEVSALYKQSHPQVELLVNFAASGALAKQIVAGAPADIYISANPKWMKYLQEQGVVAEETTKTLVYNSLVLAGSPNAKATALKDVLQMRSIAIGSPKSVPAGKYAEQALTAANLYQQLQQEKKLILAKDVRQALLYADRGEVAGAFVYRTDAMLAKQAKILFEVPQDLYPQVTYPATLLKGAEGKTDVEGFYAFLFSPEGQQIFVKYGFLLAN
ncbi:molybdate ABC transporter substrate-binding protein [Desulfuromusa kysingii]|nr:molybdate ABC transporter substrate-binding protein [Desulfuromusa kysingii]